MTVWLVTSLHRSGSSMMMRGLIAGGMQGVYGVEQDWLNIELGRPGYQPNPHGFYALDDSDEFRRPDFQEEYSGKLVKLTPDMSMSLPAGSYRVIFMERNPDQILASMLEMSPYSLFTLEPAIWFYKKIKGALISRLSGIGATVDVVKFSDVVSSPLSAFSSIAGLGWPIDPILAAAVVDPALYRNT